MHSFESIMQGSEQVEAKIGYTFQNKQLLAQAFVHRSYFNEKKDFLNEHNERLEFLGDCVLNLIVSDYLYGKLPSHAEGQLSCLRAHIVEASSCAQFLEKLGVGEFVLLGKGERHNEGRGRESIFADLFEALMGAIYLDGGLEASAAFFFRHFQPELDTALTVPYRNWKAELQDYSQKKCQKPPSYKIISEMGPDHSKIFHISVWVDNQELGTGSGASKKQAEQAAAANALQKISPIS